jgi:hypothetical protein
MNFNTPIFQDAEKETQLKTNRQVYFEIQMNRYKRFANALHKEIKILYPQKPLFSKEDLERVCETLKNSNSDLYEGLQQKFDNGEYVVPGTPGWEYRTEYLTAIQNYVQNFVWPNEEELGIRSQEEQELLAFLEQNS